MFRELLLRWCVGEPGLGQLEDWTPLRALRAEYATQEYVAGEVVSSARAIGNRRNEAVIAERERRLREMRRREMKAVDGGKAAWR
jgi:hypothetical protein